MTRFAVCALLLAAGACALTGLERPCTPAEIVIDADPGVAYAAFLMGGDSVCNEDEDAALECSNSVGDQGDRTVPPHVVHLAPYRIDQTEVTNLQYRECVDDGVCDPPGDCVPGNPVTSFLYGCRYERRDFDDVPVVAVDWENARAYCQFRGRDLDERFRWDLPTEAQWERAAVGPRGAQAPAPRFPWGDEDITPERARVVDENRCNSKLDDAPLPVRGDARSAGQSAEGVYDLTGNVREWVRDDFDQAFYCRDGTKTEPRPAIWNECGGGSRMECLRTDNAPLTGFVENPEVTARNTNLKVVRGGAFCSTNQSQVRHNCDLVGRARFGMDKDFQTADVPVSQVAGFINDAQLTGFRCARLHFADTPDDGRACERNPVDPHTYQPPDAGPSADGGG